MLQLINIYNSLKTIYNNNFTLQAQVGQLIAGWEKEGVERPYAIVNIVPLESEFTTGSLYIQVYRVEITTWIADSISVAYGIGKAFYALLNRYTKLANLTDGASTLQIISLPLEVQVDSERDTDVSTGMPIEVFKVISSFEIYLDEILNT